jgi:hypothetical protein
MLRYFLSLIFSIATASCFSQISKAQLEEEFRKFDITGEGYLSGTEITTCKCKGFDANGDNIIVLEEYLEGKGVKVKTAVKKSSQTTANKEEQPSPTDATKQQGNGDCNFEPPAPKYANTAPFSVVLAKRNLYDGYSRKVNGTSMAPSRVGVNFLEFKALTPYKNTVRIDPGRGALRINDAAPPNVTIYPVKSVHIVCEVYTTGTTRYKVESEYDCFVDRHGEWACGSSGKLPPKITQMNQ